MRYYIKEYRQPCGATYVSTFYVKDKRTGNTLAVVDTYAEAEEICRNANGK